MASMAGPYLNPDPLLRLVRGAPMLNKVLASICKAEGLQSSGVKADLQQRISDAITLYAATGDVPKFERLKRMLENPNSIQPSPHSYRNGQYSSSPIPQPRFNTNSQVGSYGMGAVNGFIAAKNIGFKSTPFYTIQRQIGGTEECDIMAQHRNTVSIFLKTSDDPILSNVSNDKLLRVMIFCAGETGHPRQDISFPHQSEVKVNGGDVKANLRGLKNKPGSTRPVDITDALRLKPPHYHNKVEMTYALTNKAGGGSSQKFYFMVLVVKTVPVAQLLDTLRVGKKISRESVLNEMATKARDADIVTMSTVMSLKCPLSTLRMQLPCRSTSCRHVQCFDGESYLQLQEQGPTWSCPICSNPAPFESLAVDEYVKDILSNTSLSVDQVTIEPDGKWSQNSKTESPSHQRGAHFASDEDDDLVEIKDSRVASLRYESTPAASVIRTPSGSGSREQSASLGAPRPPSSKRPISQVIDLTLSDDDDDDEPIARAPKRQYTGPYGTPQSMNSFAGQTNY